MTSTTSTSPKGLNQSSVVIYLAQTLNAELRLCTGVVMRDKLRLRLDLNADRPDLSTHVGDWQAIIMCSIRPAGERNDIEIQPSVFEPRKLWD